MCHVTSDVIMGISVTEFGGAGHIAKFKFPDGRTHPIMVICCQFYVPEWFDETLSVLFHLSMLAYNIEFSSD